MARACRKFLDRYESVMWKAIIVTGASRGFGRAIAASFAKSISSPVFFILLGRDTDGLKETEKLIRASRPEVDSKVELIVCDLSDVPSLKIAISKVFDLFCTNSELACDDVTLINNAGSLGPLAAVGSGTYMNEDIINAVNLNITSFMIITNEFIKWIHNTNVPSQKVKAAFLVNISSLAAIQPFESWSVYCAAKAARDMYFCTIAKEVETNKSNLRILNYAPGPLDTDMQREIREGPSVDLSIKETFMKMKADNLLIDANASANKLFSIIQQNDFENGAHIDYFDA